MTVSQRKPIAPTPPSDHPSSQNDPTKPFRKTRITKACDRCRLKKCKCDGLTPCTRCRSDNAVCIFGARRSAHQKRCYPRGYVFQLEQQQAALADGLQIMYQRAKNEQGWVGKPLEEVDVEDPSGRVLTHGILERLGLLDAFKAGGSGEGGFEEDVEALKRRMVVKEEEDEDEEDDDDADTDDGGVNKRSQSPALFPPALLWEPNGNSTDTSPTATTMSPFSSRQGSGSELDFRMVQDNGLVPFEDANDVTANFANPLWLLQDGSDTGFNPLMAPEQSQKMLHTMPS